MNACLDPGQGQVLGALGIYLSEARKVSMRPMEDSYGPVVLSLHSAPWASLTFVGDRHHIVVRLPAGSPERSIDATAIDVPERIVAVERVAWERGTDGVVLTLDLLAIRSGGDAAADGRRATVLASAQEMLGADVRPFRDVVACRNVAADRGAEPASVT